MMNKSKTLQYSILLIISFLTNNPVINAQAPIDSIKKVIKSEVEGKRSRSIIVGIVGPDGTQIFAEGIKSELDQSLPDGNTIYEIGSITKVFTSLLLSQMSLRKELNLNDPISKYLPPEVKTPSENGQEITLLSLSTHRSGMPRFPYNVDPKDLTQAYKDYSIEDLYQYISNFVPPYAINSKWKYSNVGYGLLGNILTLVARKDFEALLRTDICKTLNLRNTSITLSEAQKMNMATGHAETGIPVDPANLGAIAPGGALRSTVNDLLHFSEANLGLVETDLRPAMELTHILRAKKDGDNSYTTMGNLKEYPNSLLAMESLGETYRRHGDLEKARTYFKAAQVLDPQNEHWNFILEKLDNSNVGVYDYKKRPPYR